MKRIPQDMIAGTIHESRNCGKIKIIEYINEKIVKISFVDSGYVTTAKSCHIRVGSVKDKTKPVVCGVGYIGDGIHTSRINGSKTEAYERWSNMISRCYSKGYQDKFPTYKGCEVCDEWHNFQNFAEWFYENAPKDLDGHNYHIDKDIVGNGKLYSPENCIFVSACENIKHSIGCYERVVKIKSPSGDIYSVSNIKKFCDENGFNYKGFQHLISGKRKSNYGWVVVN